MQCSARRGEMTRGAQRAHGPARAAVETAGFRDLMNARVQSCVRILSGYSTPSGTIQVPNPNHGRTLSSHPQPNEPFLKSREPSQPSRPKSPVASAVRPPSVRPLAERPPSRNINTPYAVAAPQRPRVCRTLASSLDATLCARDALLHNDDPLPAERGSLVRTRFFSRAC